MSEYRNAKGVTARYTSFDELRKGFGLKPIRKRTKNEEKLEAQREKFVGTCRVCKQPLTWIEGTNICTCKNEECKGIEKTGANSDGTEYTYYIPVVRILNDKGMEIAFNLFGD